jgi:hypothetical protein
MIVECERCHSKAEREHAQEQGWIIMQKAAAAQGIMYILCRHCLIESQSSIKEGSLATIDIKEDTPVRRKRGKNASH